MSPRRPLRTVALLRMERAIRRANLPDLTPAERARGRRARRAYEAIRGELLGRARALDEAGASSNVPAFVVAQCDDDEVVRGWAAELHQRAHDRGGGA